MLQLFRYDNDEHALNSLDLCRKVLANNRIDIQQNKLEVAPRLKISFLIIDRSMNVSCWNGCLLCLGTANHNLSNKSILPASPIGPDNDDDRQLLCLVVDGDDNDWGNSRPSQLCFKRFKFSCSEWQL